MIEYKTICKKKTLYKAWQKIKSNGLKSTSSETRNEIRLYEQEILFNINSLSGRLSSKTFKFAPARGVPIPRPGKSPRPIVVAPTDNKIIQRAILDVLQDDPLVSHFVNVQGSYGGIKDVYNPKNVGTAISDIQDTIDQGYSWYARADIRSFFVDIPRDSVITKIGKYTPDEDFMCLFRAALTTELENMNELSGKAKLFPIHEVGVAQGCCLSPFIGNALLHDFDESLNTGGVRCFRYIDDFLILAKSKKKLDSAIERALKKLNDLGLTVYDPREGGEKAKLGRTNEEIQFLGVILNQKIIRPSDDSKKKLLEKIDKLLNNSMIQFNQPYSCYLNNTSLVSTLKSIDDILQGWITQYSFCNDVNFLRRLNNIIDKRLKKYISQYAKVKNSISEDGDKRRILGVRYFNDSDWQSIDTQ